MNLVGPGPIALHFDDADAVALALRTLAHRDEEPLLLGTRWADLGSGAGFPGIALAAHHPQIQIDLIESRERRVAFLQQVIRSTGLENARVQHVRAERIEAQTYDGVIARAFAPPARYLPLAAELVKTGGCVVVLANRQVDNPVESLRAFHVERYRSGGKDRLMVVFKKI